LQDNCRSKAGTLRHRHLQDLESQKRRIESEKEPRIAPGLLTRHRKNLLLFGSAAWAAAGQPNGFGSLEHSVGPVSVGGWGAPDRECRLKDR
jgi:hypothetical protein